MTTKEEDVWACSECGILQGRHDQWFEGECEDCHTNGNVNKVENEIIVCLNNADVKLNATEFSMLAESFVFLLAEGPENASLLLEEYNHQPEAEKI